eukprot:3223879-Rhodomonas_salina.1
MGRAHTCVVLAGGGVSCWTRGARRPHGVLLDVAVREVHCGDEHTCAITSYFDVRCWGANEHAQLGVPGEGRGVVLVPLGGMVVALSATGNRTCAAVQPSPGQTDVKCWGSERHRVLGQSDTAEYVYAQSAKSIPLRDKGAGAVTRVTLARNHACTLFDDGRVKCWGLLALLGVGQGTLGASTAHGLAWDTLDFADLRGSTWTLHCVQDISAGGSATCVL